MSKHLHGHKTDHMTHHMISVDGLIVWNSLSLWCHLWNILKVSRIAELEQHSNLDVRLGLSND